MTAGTLPAPLTHVHVVVPARDEERLLPRALAALDRAVEELRRARPEVTASVTLVLDACVDGSSLVASRHPAVSVLEVDRRCVGAARAAGVAVATAAWSGSESGSGSAATSGHDRHWVASTDADCSVPRDWLVRQVALADAGVDLVTGTVEPDDELVPAALARWWERHRLVDGHPHVHGANLGIRLSTYAVAGGFEPVDVHEDVGLERRARASGATCLASAELHVRTSGRTTGRTPGGFAGYLAALGADPSPTA